MKHIKKFNEDLSSGYPGGTKSAEYRRSADLFEEILNEKGMYYAISLWYDSGYDREDLLGMMEVLKPGKGKLSDF